MSFFSWLKWQFGELLGFFFEIPKAVWLFLKGFNLNFLDSRKEVTPDWWENKWLNLLFFVMAFFCGGVYALFRVQNVCNQFIVDNRLVKPFEGATVQVLLNSSLNNSFLASVPTPHYSPFWTQTFLVVVCCFVIAFLAYLAYERLFFWFRWYAPRLVKSFCLFLWQDTLRTLKFFKAFFTTWADEPLTKKTLEKQDLKAYSWREMAKVSVKDILKAFWLFFVLLILLFHVGDSYYTFKLRNVCQEFIIKEGLTVDLSELCLDMNCLIGNTIIRPVQNLNLS